MWLTFAILYQMLPFDLKNHLVRYVISEINDDNEFENF